MPLAPLLARIRSPDLGIIRWSRSLIGRLDAAHSSAPSGSAAARSLASFGSLSKSSVSRTASTAAAVARSASSHPDSHPDGRSGSGPDNRPASRTLAATAVALLAGSDHRPGP